MRENLLLTVDEVAERLRLSRNKVYDLLHTQQIPHIRLGRQFRIPSQAFEIWIDAASAIEMTDADEIRLPHQLIR